VKSPVNLVRDLVAGSRRPSAGRRVLILALGLGLIFLALVLITRNMRQLVRGSVERAMNHIVGRGGGAVGILIGVLVTVAVQSSTITTSILVPLVAAGLLTARSAYPITLGANVGTTVTALIASLAVTQPAGLTIALVHTLFNVTALAARSSRPIDRDVPVRLAEGSPDRRPNTRHWSAGYLLGLFLIIPLDRASS
jgi:solute carrier family 34 (sodium-dependent phosphate cotransporter)